MDTMNMAMELIAGAGDSKSYSMEAIIQAKEGDFEKARESISKAADALRSTHDVQTTMIGDEMQGKTSEITLLMVHAQDHLTSALLMRDLAEEFVDLYETLGKKGE
jgi:PTS system cellobiose-specific IIA component